ncbi:MAG: 30S ribosome-binding factor RbfA [Bacteriovoracaceae bacterium]|nr:30S ribosome-binding factor RbfA [Bacteriovoracaceae bacterium]
MAGKNNLKKIQFEGRILTELNSILRTKLNNPRLQFVSITKVSLTHDMSLAIVYWDSFDSSTRGDTKKAISTIGGKLRSILAQSLKVRTVPELRFEYDSQYEAEKEVEEILANEAKLGKHS